MAEIETTETAVKSKSIEHKEDHVIDSGQAEPNKQRPIKFNHLRQDVGIQFLKGHLSKRMVPMLRRIGFTLLYDCDGDCSYCFVKSDRESLDRTCEISQAEFERILSQAVRLGLEEVQLSGGEPLLKNDILEFVRIAKNFSVKVGIFTNGVLLNKNILKKLKLLGLDWIRVSLGGSNHKISQWSGRANDTKERFEKILNNIKASVEAGLVTGLFTPVTKNNYKDIRNIAELAKELGVKYIIFCNYIPLGTKQDRLNRMNTNEQYQAIEEFLKAKEEQEDILDVYAYYGFFEYLSPNWGKSNFVIKSPCGIERLAFIANGDVRTCLCATPAIDNFRRNTFNLLKLWREHPFLAEIRKYKGFEPCLYCKRKNICHPCLAAKLNLNDGIDVASPQCPAVREYNFLRKTMAGKDAAKKALTLKHNYKEPTTTGV